MHSRAVRTTEIWGDMGRYGEIWGDMGRSQPRRADDAVLVRLHASAVDLLLAPLGGEGARG